MRVGKVPAAKMQLNTSGYEQATPGFTSCSHPQVLIAVVFPSHMCRFSPKPLGFDEPLGWG